MPKTDPLALRHGALIAHVWTVIGRARVAARTGTTPTEAACHIRRLAHQRAQVLAAHRTELQRQDFSTATIDNWFAAIETTLSKAERHFQSVIAASRLESSEVKAA